MKKNLMFITLMVFAFSCFFCVSCCPKKKLIQEEEIAVLPEVTTVEEAEAAPAPVADIGIESGLLVTEKARVEEIEEEAKEAYKSAAQMFEDEPIYFDFDKSFIKPEYRTILMRKADFLKTNPAIAIRIEGNCDERGTNEYNLALGERRANSAREFLMSLGISPDRIETLSYGEERPLALGHNEQAWSQNRRDDFVIVGR